MRKQLIALLKYLQTQNRLGKIYLETIDSCEDMNTVSVFEVKPRKVKKFLFSITVEDRDYEKYLY